MGILDPISVAVRVGVDLGQQHDYTAIVVAEIQRRDYTLISAPGGPVPQGGRWIYIARLVERLPLGTPYPTVVERLKQIDQKLDELAERKHLFMVDATGVGQPV